VTRAAGSAALAATSLAVAALALGADSPPASAPVEPAPAAAVGTAAHWSYARDPIEVVSTGSADEAAGVAQRLQALDNALREMLRLPKGGSSPPTHVYVLPASELAALDPLWSSQGGGFFRAAPFDDYLVLASGHGPALDPEIRATRTQALLASWGLARLPDWFRQGIAQLAAGATFDDDAITIGQDAAGRESALASGWIPMEKIFRLPSNAQEFQSSPERFAQYRAQCWWLAHLLLIERVLDPAIRKYIERLMAGEDQKTAFLSFNTSYEQIDEYFRKVRRNVHLRNYSDELPPTGGEGAPPPPRPLGENPWRASVAQLALVHDGRSEHGLALAREALAADADNETALLAMTRGELAARHFNEADALMQRLHAREDLSGEARRGLAGLEFELAKQREERLPGTQDLDAHKLREAARADFRRVLEADPADLRALYQHSWLEASLGDVARVRALLPAVEQAYFRHSDSPELAALLVRMHSLAGSPADVFKYSVAEQRLAVTEAERITAAARVERLRSQVKLPQ
jgi:hypothetical protein